MFFVQDLRKCSSIESMVVSIAEGHHFTDKLKVFVGGFFKSADEVVR